MPVGQAAGPDCAEIVDLGCGVCDVALFSYAFAYSRIVIVELLLGSRKTAVRQAQ
jgi:predicted RNA methylase